VSALPLTKASLFLNNSNHKGTKIMASVTSSDQTKLNKIDRRSKKAALGDKMYLWSHKAIAAGTQATVAGSASQTITIAGCLSTDIAIVVLKTVGAAPKTITTAAAASGQINVVMSGDPSTDHVLSYMLLRAL
jgi:hypothetical protein